MLNAVSETSGPRHEHEHGDGHHHEHGAGILARVRHVVRPHSHEAADKVDAAMEASAEGMRALWVSLLVLGCTALTQAAVVAISGSCALRGDAPQTPPAAPPAAPGGRAFVGGGPPRSRRYTYGYGRAEDLAGV